jgi:hypothetical protein
MAHWCLLLYAFSIPLEHVNLGFTSQYLSSAKMIGLLFFATYFFYYNPLLASWPSPSRACCWFLGYAAIYILNGFFLPEKLALNFFLGLSTMLQLIMFFWMAGDLSKDEKIMRQVWLMYALAASILAVGMVLQLPAFTPTIHGTAAAGQVERSTVMGYDSNMLAAIWALAIVALVGLCLHPAYTLCTKLLLACLALVILVGMGYAGSRAGIGSLLIGFLVYLAPNWRTQRKLCSVLIGLFSIAITVYFAMHNATITQRWQETVEGKLDGREQILPAALKMFIERPLIGWQPIISGRELGRRLGTYNRDTHNLFLTLLLDGGIVGTVPFLMGIWRCAQTTWQDRTGRLGLLPLALLITVLAVAMAQPVLWRKWFWLVLACASHSPAAAHATRPRILLMRRSLGNEV